jgi:proteasome accessory factor B
LIEKTERLFNLIALLLDTRRPLTAREIREKVPGFSGQSDDAFHRKFERDKDEIRELGYVLEQVDIDGWGELGYRIRTDDGLLDDPGLTPDEMAALSLAARAWSGAPDGSIGFLKLSVGASVAEPVPGGVLTPRVSLDHTIGVLQDAIARHKAVSFRYRSSGGDPERREVDPYGLLHRGTWYLAGFDHARGAVRHFRLSRVEGAISVRGGKRPDFEAQPDVVLEVRRGPWEGGETGIEARIAFAPETVWWAERRTGARRVAELPDGWGEAVIPIADPDQFVGWVAGFGGGAVVLEPPELRDAVVEWLRLLAEPKP